MNMLTLSMFHLDCTERKARLSPVTASNPTIANLPCGSTCSKTGQTPQNEVPDVDGQVPTLRIHLGHVRKSLARYLVPIAVRDDEDITSSELMVPKRGKLRRSTESCCTGDVPRTSTRRDLSGA